MHITISPEDREKLKSRLKSADKQAVRLYLERMT